MARELRVAFLTNLIPPYHKPLYLLLSRRYKPFRILISTPMEANRPWVPEWAGLDVIAQKAISFRRRWRHPSGFEESVAIHFPVDTLSLLAQLKPDVVVSVEMGFRTLLAFLYSKLHRDCRLLIWSEVTAMTEQGRGQGRRMLRRFLARHADGVFALGPDGVAYMRSMGANPARIFQIAYSTGLEPFLELPLHRAGPAATHLLFSGQLVARKGLLPFLKTLAEWANRHPERAIQFTFVGAGPEQSNLLALPIPSNVKLVLIGSVQYHQLPGFYAGCGIVVLPTLADTWAVVVNEALASGLPVLGSVYSQAVKVMVSDGKNGWTFRPDHADEMYHALDRALSASEAELNGMRVSARQSAMAVTPDQVAKTFATALSLVTERP